MGLAYNTYLTSNKIYGCKTCKAHLANHEDIISRVRIPWAFAFVALSVASSLELTGRQTS
jgi:hypothetical protein